MDTRLRAQCGIRAPTHMVWGAGHWAERSLSHTHAHTICHNLVLNVCNVFCADNKNLQLILRTCSQKITIMIKTEWTYTDEWITIYTHCLQKPFPLLEQGASSSILVIHFISSHTSLAGLQRHKLLGKVIISSNREDIDDGLSSVRDGSARCQPKSEVSLIHKTAARDNC